MELSWSSIILEIVNFLVLIWILKHFFYSPIQKTINERKKMIQDKLDNAEKLNLESSELQKKYENRLAEWQQEKDKMKKKYEQTMEQWKLEEKANFEAKLKEEQKIYLSRDMNKFAEISEKNAKESFVLAGKFSAKLLMSFADAHLEKKIIEKMIEDLNSFPAEKLQLIADLAEQNQVIVQSAYPINKHQQQDLLQAINKLVHRKLSADFSENPDLFAGLSIQLGSIILQANLRDELKFFTEIKNGLA
ncbi:F0F1 ATP synthase subunit delta [Legionella drancourtii]|nr:F0F1 ATP synthase subunit delta [Legionella drancourtii]